jgi:hypothetical protein
MAYKQSYSTRRSSSVVTSVISICFLAISVALLSKTSIGLLGVAMAFISTGVAAYSIYFWLRPVLFEISISDQFLRYKSPHMPRVAREIPLTEISEAWTSATDPETVELSLKSGEHISIPAPCVPDPRELIVALTTADRGSKAGIKIKTFNRGQ